MTSGDASILQCGRREPLPAKTSYEESGDREEDGFRGFLVCSSKSLFLSLGFFVLSPYLSGHHILF